MGLDFPSVPIIIGIKPEILWIKPEILWIKPEILWIKPEISLDQARNSLDQARNSLDQARNSLDRARNYLDQARHSWDRAQERLLPHELSRWTKISQPHTWHRLQGKQPCKQKRERRARKSKVMHLPPFWLTSSVKTKGRVDHRICSHYTRPSLKASLALCT